MVLYWTCGPFHLLQGGPVRLVDSAMFVDNGNMRRTVS